MAEVEKDEEHGGLNLKGKPLLFSGTGASEGNLLIGMFLLVIQNVKVHIF